jgi:hypothetical protein
VVVEAMEKLKEAGDAVVLEPADAREAVKDAVAELSSGKPKSRRAPGGSRGPAATKAPAKKSAASKPSSTGSTAKTRTKAAAAKQPAAR